VCVCVCVLQEKRLIYLFYFLSDARLDFSREIRRTLKSCSIPVGTEFYFIYFLFLFCFVITENLEERSPECGVNTGVTQSRFIGIDSFLFSYLSLKFSFFFFSDTHMRKRRRSRMIHLTYRRRILRITSVTTFLRRKFFSIQKGKIMSLTCHPGRHDEKEWDDGRH
jgi:hypothetical protein